MTEPTRARINPYPPYVQTDEERRRWRLVTCSALLVYGYKVGQALSSGDRALIWYAQRALFQSDLATGDGDLADYQRTWLVDLGLL